MAAKYLPTVGEKGLFTFSAGIVTPTTTGWEVTQVIKIRDLKVFDVDLTAEYKKTGAADLETDIANNETIVRLANPKAFVYMPLRCILSFPSTNNYGYQHRILGLNLGELPSDLDLVPLIAKLQAVVEKEIGVVGATGKVASQGEEKWYSAAEHKARATQREQAKDYSPTLGAQVEKLTAQLHEANTTIGLLEELLQGNQPSA